MNKLRRLIILLGAAALAPAPAQDAPASHTVDFPRGPAAWTIVFERPAAQGQETAPAAEKMDIVRQDNLRRDTIHWSDGTVREQWWSANPAVLLFESPNGTVSAMKGAYAAERRYDESSFGWVGAKTFVGMDSVRGKKCQYYEKEIADTGDSSITMKWRAWIDPASHRPVAYDNGFSTVFFTFAEAAPPPLAMPAKFEKKLRRYQAFYAPAQKSAR